MAKDMVEVDRSQLNVLVKTVSNQKRDIKELQEENAKLRATVQSGRTAQHIEPPSIGGGKHQKFNIGGVGGHINTGEYADGSLAEVFLSVGKAGTTVQGLCESLARTFSIALQHGVPLRELIHTLKGLEFMPYGPIQYDDQIKGAKSIADYFATWLNKQYITKPAEKREKREQEAIQTIKQEVAEDSTEYEECPSCGEKGLKPKAIGCDSMCVKCGYYEPRGCSA